MFNLLKNREPKVVDIDSKRHNHEAAQLVNRLKEALKTDIFMVSHYQEEKDMRLQKALDTLAHLEALQIFGIEVDLSDVEGIDDLKQTKEGA